MKSSYFWCQAHGAAFATLTRKAWMGVISCAVEGDITPSRKGEVIMLYHDNDEDRSDDDFMSHAWWWSRASYFQIRSPSHPDPIHDPFLGPLTFSRHHVQHLILLLTIMIMFFMTFPPELKSVASASSTGAVTSSARHAQSLSSSLSVNNLLITIKRPFSTKTSFWFYSPFTFQLSYSMNLSTFVQGWFSLPAVHWTIVPGRSSTLHVNRQPQDINTGSPQLQHHRPILHKLIREGSKKTPSLQKIIWIRWEKRLPPSRWIGEFPYWKIRF